MTTDLEKKFFDTFGIEPDITSCYHRCKKDLNCKECNEAKVIYPQITDRILLELICIANHNGVYVNLEGPNIETIKNHLLEYFIFFRRDVKKYVQELFKEGKKC